MPTLSIIVPVYNVKPYLNRCVRSILAQTFQNFELILVDDGSTDGSGELCDNLQEGNPKIKVLHQPNSGLSVARNSGLSVAQGEWVGFVDSDDWLEPEIYTKMLFAADVHSADIVICRHKSVSTEGQLLEVVGVNKEKVMDNIEATKLILGDDVIRSFAWNKVYRRSLFDSIHYPVGRIFEDTATTYKLFYRAKRVATIPYIGYDYLANPHGTLLGASENTEKWTRSFIDNCRAFTERYLFSRTHKEFSDIVPMCANKAYLMTQGFLHACAKRDIQLDDCQKKVMETILDTIYISDLSKVPIKQKTDIYLFKINRRMLWGFLNLIN